jgi:predicted nucleotidyltransferase
MTGGIVTLKERHRREMERMARAIVDIDAALAAYARQHGGSFIRFGSTAEGRMRRHSDVDIIADSPARPASRSLNSPKASVSRMA